MNKKMVAVISLLLLVILVMAGFLIKDYIVIGKPEAEVAVTEELAGNNSPEAEGAETTMVAAATTTAGGATTAAGPTAAPTTTAAAATTADGATTAATTKSLNITTTAPQIGGLVTTTQAMGGIVTTTQGMGVLVTTTGTLAVVGPLPTGKPDLVVNGNLLSGPLQTLKPFYQVAFNGFTVKNIGTVPSGDFWIGYYLAVHQNMAPSLSQRWYINGNYYGSLNPGQELYIAPTVERLPSASKIEETKGIEKGERTMYVGVLVDAHNEVDELSETNNYLSSPIWFIYE